MISIVWNSSIGNVRHLWPEKSEFEIKRPDGLNCFTFWHFLTPVEIDTSEGTIVTEPHACYLCPPFTPQHFIAHVPLIHDWIHFDETSAVSWKKYGLEYNRPYYPLNPSFISDTVQKIEIENLTMRLGYEQMIESKISELFIQIARSLNSHMPHLDNKILESFKKLRLNILENLNENWTVKRMADYVNVSESYFHMLYKQIYGISPTRDIINSRISSAQSMLANTNMSIGEISKSLGFNNPYHFSRQFRQITGKSPSFYRKEL